MAKKITKRAIDALTPPEAGVSFLFDSEVKGFGVRVTAGGVKSFIWQGRLNGQKYRMTIARFGSLTAEKARLQAKRIAGEIAAGKDPRAEKQRRKAESLTLGKAFEEYLAERDLKETTRADIQRAMASLSDWRSKPVISITRDMVAKRHRKIGASSPSYANLVMRYLRAVLNYAREAHAQPDGRPLLADNPVNRLSATKSWYRVQPRRTFLAPHELPKWMSAVQGLPEPPERDPGTGKQLPKLKTGDIARDFLMLLLLTGLRRSEAADLMWENVDLEGRTLMIPDPKNREAHTLPLSDYLLELLLRRQRSSRGPYVFSNEEGQRFSSIKFAINRVEKVSGIRATCHDLRRTFATVAESLDIPAYAVKGLLNHKSSGDVTASYIQITPERLRLPMQRITDYILKTAGVLPAENPVDLTSRRTLKELEG